MLITYKRQAVEVNKENLTKFIVWINCLILKTIKGLLAEGKVNIVE